MIEGPLPGWHFIEAIDGCWPVYPHHPFSPWLTEDATRDRWILTAFGSISASQDRVAIKSAVTGEPQLLAVLSGGLLNAMYA